MDELRLFIGNLKPSTTQQVLREYFSRYGKVTKVDLILDRESRKPRGIAFVNMSTPMEVDAILDARPHKLDGESIVVRHAHLRASKWVALPLQSSGACLSVFNSSICLFAEKQLRWFFVCLRFE